MTASITGFVSRADAKMRPPLSVTRRITPDRGGAAVHHGGPAQKIRSHAECIARWRAWQTFHMAPKPQGQGWADIAYTGGFCDHGYALAGRGLGVRTAANGTNAGNQDYYAFVWLGGHGETPSKLALDALEWWVQQAREHDAGMRVRPHRVFTSTQCPGPHLATAAAHLDNRPITTAALTTPPAAPPTLLEEDDMPPLVFPHGADWWLFASGRTVKVPNMDHVRELIALGAHDARKPVVDPDGKPKQLSTAFLGWLTSLAGSQ